MLFSLLESEILSYTFNKKCYPQKSKILSFPNYFNHNLFFISHNIGIVNFKNCSLRIKQNEKNVVFGCKSPLPLKKIIKKRSPMLEKYLNMCMEYLYFFNSNNEKKSCVQVYKVSLWRIFKGRMLILLIIKLYKLY